MSTTPLQPDVVNAQETLATAGEAQASPITADKSAELKRLIAHSGRGRHGDGVQFERPDPSPTRQLKLRGQIQSLLAGMAVGAR